MRSLRGGKIAQEESGLLGCLNGDIGFIHETKLLETNHCPFVLGVLRVLGSLELV